MASSTARLGWIGLGSMGLGMATNLQKHVSEKTSSQLRYFNRTMSRGTPLQAIGGVPADSVKELVGDSDIIFMSLSDDAALSATLDAMLQASESLRGKIVVDTSTVHPMASAKAQARLAEHGAQFVAAPVFGASPVAVAGQLLWIVAGPDDAVLAIEPFVVGVMGRAWIRLGEEVQKASMLKTAGNFLTAGMMELIAEAHVLAETTGLGTAAMEDLLAQQYGPLAHTISQRLTTGAYLPARDARPWSDLDLAVKDVGLGIDSAERAGARLEVAEVAMRHLKEAQKYGQSQGRKVDSSGLFGAVRMQGGLAFETEVVKKRDGDA